MKLKLPFALLAALLVCMNGAVAEESTDQTVIVGTSENDMGMTTVEGNAGNRFIVGNVLWNTPYVLSSSLPLSIGTSEGVGSLTIAAGVQAGTGSATFIGGKGWYSTRPADYATLTPHEGTLTIEKDATFAVGTGTSSASGAHLDIGCTPNGSGTINVKGGTLSSDYAIYVGMAANAVGTINVTDGGHVKLAVAPHITGLYQEGGYVYGTTFQVACYEANAQGVINLEEGSTLEIVGSDRGYNYNQLGEKAGSSAEMNLSGGSSVTFTDMNNYVGQSGQALISVTGGSSLTINSAGIEGNQYASDSLRLGVYAGGEGRIEVSGTHAEDGTASSLNVEGYTHIGDSGDGAVALSAGAEATFGGYVLVGGWGSSTGSLDVASGAGATLNSDLYLGYGSAATGSSTVTGGESSLGIKGNAYVGNSGSGTMTVSEGASVTTDGFLCLGFAEGSSGTVNVEGEGSSLNATSGVTYVGYNGEGELNVSSGAEAYMGAVEVSSQGSLSVTDGASAVVLTDMSVAAGSTVTVKDSIESGKSGLAVLGNYTNEGKTVLDLSNGGTFFAGTVENTSGGVMEVTLDNGGAFAVNSFVNRGDADITAAAGTTCDLGTMQLVEGSMTLDGEGSFTMGSSASNTEFTVTGTSAETAVSTNIDISTLSSKNFTIDASSCFTFRFTDEILAALYASAADATDLELTVIKGFVGFTVEQAQLDQLIANTQYLFGSEVAAVTFALESASPQYGGIVTNARYEMRGNDLVWTGTVEVIPEPATATLSLLALAGLAARRRRK